MFSVQTLPLGPVQTNAFLVTHGARAFLVDAPAGCAPAVEGLLGESGAELEALLLTHGHWDHTTDAHLFTDWDVPIYGHEGDRHFFDSPQVMAAFTVPGVPLRPAGVTDWLTGETLEIAGLEVEVRHVPGHAPGNVLFYLHGKGVAFVGDVIFARGVGRFDLPGGDFEVLSRSIREQVYTLPDDTILYPGHGPATTVGEEKAGNPYVRAAD